MCGIAGVVAPTLAAAELNSLAVAMGNRLLHRGPDDAGQWSDPANGVALSHRRLAVIDLSPQGHQPMLSDCGRYVLVFNGEIYNHRRLRATLEGAGAAPPWRGHSDTETLLAAVAHWGLSEALSRCVGMFAFALYDRQRRLLHLARDRMGEKPLYYGWAGGLFLFASEPKAFAACRGWPAEVSPEALTRFLRLGYVPAPHSIFHRIWKVAPGSFVSAAIDDLSVVRDSPLPAYSYWSLPQVAAAGLADPFPGTLEEAVGHLEGLLRQTLREQMVADVPVGAFLSGGIDSTTVVSLLQKESRSPVRTFTIAFNQQGYCEAEQARAVADFLGTDHTELAVTAEDALALLPRLPEIYDEPFADPSQIPTFLLAMLTRRQVTVSLSGDGGDELFGGYNRYFLTRDIWRRFGWLPAVARTPLTRALASAPDLLGERCFSWLGPIAERYGHRDRVAGKLRKLAEVVAAATPQELYQRLISLWPQPEALVAGALPVAVAGASPAGADLLRSMMGTDQSLYLPDDILVKVDRAAMAVSLETRVPLLDHRIVEFAWRLPPEFLVRGNQGKWVLRQLLYRQVPQTLIDRPKMGFAVPIGDWLRGPLRDWAEALLAEVRLRREGYLNPQPIRARWEEHLAGHSNRGASLWGVLMFQQWLEKTLADRLERAPAAPERIVVAPASAVG